VLSSPAWQIILTNDLQSGGPHTTDLTGKEYMLSGDKTKNQDQRKEILGKIYAPCQWEHQIREYYHQTTYQLIKSHSNQLQKSRYPLEKNTYQLDVVKE
jgi:hypothetical protein